MSNIFDDFDLDLQKVSTAPTDIVAKTNLCPALPATNASICVCAKTINNCVSVVVACVTNTCVCGTYNGCLGSLACLRTL